VLHPPPEVFGIRWVQRMVILAGEGAGGSGVIRHRNRLAPAVDFTGEDGCGDKGSGRGESCEAAHGSNDAGHLGPLWKPAADPPGFRRTGFCKTTVKRDLSRAAGGYSSAPPNCCVHSAIWVSSI